MTCPPGLTPLSNTRPTQPIKKHKPRDIKLNTVLSDYRGKLGEIIDNLDITKLKSVGWEDVRNYPSLKIAVAAITPNQRTLLVSTPVHLAKPTTVPSHISLWVLQGGSFSGAKLTVNGNFEAGLHQVFKGDITVILNKNPFVHPEWFGAPVDGITDDHVAFEKAIACMVASNIDTLQLSKGQYYFTDYVEINTLRQNIRITGFSTAGYITSVTDATYITGADALSTLFLFSARAYGLEVDHVRFDGRNKSTGVTSAIKSTAYGYPARPVNIHHNHFERFDKAIYITSTSSTGICTLNIEANSFHSGNYSLYSDGSYINIQGLRFVGNVSEAGASIYIADGCLAQSFIISDNMLESNIGDTDYTIRIGAWAAQGEVSRNYFESNTGTLIYFKGKTGAESIKLKDNYYSNVSGKDIYIERASLDNYDKLYTSGVRLRCNKLTAGSHYIRGGNAILYLPQTDVAYMANAIDWTSLEYDLTLSAGFSPNYIKVGDGSTFFMTPRGEKRGYETVAPTGTVWTGTDVSDVAVGDYIVGVVIFKRNSSTRNKWVNIILYDNNDVKIGEIGEDIFYPFYGSFLRFIPVHFAIRATATSTGIYKLKITTEATNSFIASDMFTYSAVGATMATIMTASALETNKVGAATIAENGTSVVVTHGMPYIPYGIRVTPTVDIGSVWVDTMGATQFTINCSSNTHAVATVYWEAY